MPVDMWDLTVVPPLGTEPSGRGREVPGSDAQSSFTGVTDSTTREVRDDYDLAVLQAQVLAAEREEAELAAAAAKKK